MLLKLITDLFCKSYAPDSLHPIYSVDDTAKVTYFNFSRGLLVDHMDRRHIAATEHLSKARQFAQVKAKDRAERLPPLTEDQREQLREYLRLQAEQDPEVYPNVENMRRG